MNIEQFEKIQLALDVLRLLPKEVNPRIGGSCALFFYGEVEDFDDIDIIVDTLTDVDLDFSQLPLKHPSKRLNETKRYIIGKCKVDIHESIMPKSKGILEPKENIYCCQKILKRYFKEVFDENVDKWD